MLPVQKTHICRRKHQSMNRTFMTTKQIQQTASLHRPNKDLNLKLLKKVSKIFGKVSGGGGGKE